MSPEVRNKLVTAVAVGAAAVSGAAIANAATNGSSSSSGQAAAPAAPYGAPPSGGQPPARDPSQGGHTVNGKTETLLSGDTASKVRAAALDKVSGTVERVETNVDGSAPYEAHIRKSNGTEVEVQVSKDFKVVAVNEMGRHP